MSKLEDMIMKASQKYYSDGSSDLTDVQFDEALEQLKKENPDSKLLTDVGHGYDENLDTTPGQRCKHRYGLIKGLKKVHNWKELSKDIRNHETVASLKLDGLSIVLYYNDGKLVQALTRGGTSGETGIDVTAKVRAIYDSYYDELRASNFTGAIRGEILMLQSSFERYVEAHKDDDKEIKNPRNTAAGLMNNKDVTDDLQYLDIFVYNVVACEEDEPFTKFTTMLNWLAACTPYRVVPYLPAISAEKMNEEQFDEIMIRYKKRFDEACGDIPSDGIVLNTEYGLINNPDTHEIRYVSEAYKFPSESAETVVEFVEWSMTKNRRYMPRVKIKEVQLGGSTINYCTGYNAKYIQDNCIIPGTVVKISKRGEVIPNIDEIVSHPSDMKLNLIGTCPECSEPLYWNGVDLECKNAACSNANVQDALAWLNYIAPLDAFGDKLMMKYLTEIIPYEKISVESIMKNKQLKNIAEHPEMYSNSIHQKLFTKRITKLFVADSDYICDIPVYNALMSLNIPRLGDVTCQKIAHGFPWMVVDFIQLAAVGFVVSGGETLGVKEYMDKIRSTVGDANTNSIEANLWKFNRLQYIKDRIEFHPAAVEKDIIKVAITGKLSVKRVVFEEELRAHGFEPGNISKDTQILITDNPDSASDKNKKADKWGIAKMTEEAFRAEYLN